MSKRSNEEEEKKEKRERFVDRVPRHIYTLTFVRARERDEE